MRQSKNTLIYTGSDLPDLAKWIRPGDTVTWGQATAEPLTLTQALVQQRHQLARIRLLTGIDLSNTFLPEHADAFDFISYCGAGGNRQLISAGLLEILPFSYSQLPQQLRTGRWQIDVLLVQVAPPAIDGSYSLGLANDWLIPAIERARVVIAEVNPDVPETFGARRLHTSEIDVIVESQHPPVEFKRAQMTEVDILIAQQVAGLVQDGSILQLGLGGVADQLLTMLVDRRDLGIHSGIVGDALVDLVESGAVTNARKSVDRGVSIAGLLMGGRRLSAHAHNNPQLQLRGNDYTHHPGILASFDQFVAINSAIEVDLTGQVNSEVAAGKYVGAVGGAPDFLRAAHLSRGGLPVIAFSAKAGSHSRIVQKLNGPVSTARCDAGIFVTEYGIADLRGLSLKERMKHMIDIAAPEYREELDRHAHVSFY